jgi:hypothetical protein
MPTATATPAVFRVGQILQALAHGNRADGLTQLQIGQEMLLARAPLAIKAGQTLTLRVERAGAAPELRILPSPPQQLGKADALRAILPRMLPLANSIAQLWQHVMTPSQTTAPPLPAAAQQAIHDLVAQLPEARQLTQAQGLRLAIEQSGLFTEARLAQQMSSPDIKSALLRVAARLRSTPTAAQANARLSASSAARPTSAESIRQEPSLKLNMAHGKTTHYSLPLQKTQFFSRPSTPASQQTQRSDVKIPAQTVTTHLPQAGGVPPSNPVKSPLAAMRLPSTPVSAQTATETATPRPPQAASTPNGLTKPPTETAAPRPPQAASTPNGLTKPPTETAAPPPPQAASAPNGLTKPPTKTAAPPPPQAASAPNGLTKPPTETAAPRPPQTASAPDGMAKSPLETMRPPSTPVTTHLTAGIRSAVLLAPTTTSPLAAPLVMTAAMEAVAKPAKDRAPTSGKTAPLGAAAESARQPLQELSRHVEGALARMQYHQLASLPPEDANRQVWQLELPVKIEQHIESVKLRIEKDQHHGEDGEQQASWRVNLAFDLEPLGPLQVRIGLQGDTVSSVFWARREHTAALIAARLEELRQGLRRVGLNVGELAARQGRLPEPDVAVAADQAVLDERA